ncbi:DNA/RNA polymerase [Hortaea werneckii]|uniref:UmuC domain-containing protein n=1 Tax=Hortaea werneckii TaxID=91943 RepID=A0A3M7CEU7_HORWE|nr:DNA/RNA polymerase [Hortaea werneckii]KAI7708733.1 DNA/RNA polymerase [Hortaea werneckii]RMY50575.1 hypothetical protein D0865_06826 [Hortaea werneckii]
MEARKIPARKDGRVIIHFDYDCFYAAVFEAKNPSLKSLPFAVQQKQIIVTCNYEARRRGLHKLQLIRDAKRVCPDVIIELGEDISRFRDASKELYSFIRAYTWNGRVERLGFDEVWMDVTDMVDYNMEIVNKHSLEQSFFQMSREDPTDGFPFDASCVAGHTYPKHYEPDTDITLDDLRLRMHLGSHLAMYMRHQLELHKGYTSTVGIATSKLLSKLVGNLNKPKGQTVLMPPLATSEDGISNSQTFMDGQEIGKVPGVGFKLAQKLREFVLQRPADFEAGLVYGGTKESIRVSDVRSHPEINPEKLEKLLGGPGSPHGIGYKIWCLLHGVDYTEVSQAKAVPSQISIEDSYIRLDTLPEVLRQLNSLSRSLIERMRIDLLGENEDASEGSEVDDNALVSSTVGKKWLAHPKTLRLTTRPRQPLQADGTRQRSFKRVSHSAPLPNFVFNLFENAESLAARLVDGALVGMFRRLHPEKAGWNLSLVNLAVTNMAETAGDSKTASGRDIGSMFKRQDDVLKDFKVVEVDEPAKIGVPENEYDGSWQVTSEKGMQVGASTALKGDCATTIDLESKRAATWDVENDLQDGEWNESDDMDEDDDVCTHCGARMPSFAMIAHRRFHQP